MDVADAMHFTGTGGTMNDGRLLVVCKDDRTLEVIDLESGELAGTASASGVAPHEVAATGDGRVAYLPVYSDAPVGSPGSDGRRVDVIDLVTFARIGEIRLDVPSRPHQATMRGGRLLVSTELDESVTVIDTRSLRILARLPTGRAESHTFAIAQDRLATANVGSGSVSIIDLASGELLGVVGVAERVNRVCLDPSGLFAYTADQGAPRIAVVDTVKRERVAWLALPAVGFGTAVTADGSRLVVALRGASEIAVLDLRSGEVLHRIATPDHPQAIALHPDGIRAYSACDVEDCVVEVDLRSGSLLRRFETGRRPDGIAWSSSPRPNRTDVGA
jgi:DNA-binding beta-propeller fold protein YncE